MVSELGSVHNFNVITKEHTSVKIVHGVTFLVLCILSNHGLHMCPVQHKYIEWFQSYEAARISTVFFTKVHYSFYNVSGVTVLILRPWSNHGLHLYQVSRKYFERFQSY